MRAAAGLIKGTLPQWLHPSYEPYPTRPRTSTTMIWCLWHSVATLQPTDAILTLVAAWQCMMSRRQPMRRKAIISMTNLPITSAIDRSLKKATSRWVETTVTSMPLTAAPTLTTYLRHPSNPLRSLSATNCLHQSSAVDAHNPRGTDFPQLLLQECRNDHKPADDHPRTDLTRTL